MPCFWIVGVQFADPLEIFLETLHHDLEGLVGWILLPDTVASKGWIEKPSSKPSKNRNLVWHVQRLECSILLHQRPGLPLLLHCPTVRGQNAEVGIRGRPPFDNAVLHGCKLFASWFAFVGRLGPSHLNMAQMSLIDLGPGHQISLDLFCSK